VPICNPDRKAPVDPTIEIFRPGRHTPRQGPALDFSAADLAAMVAAYDPAIYKAPIVVGHPATDAPAYGWVGDLSVAGDRVTASVQQVEPAFAELVRAGRYRNVSASFWAPSSPNNPKPGAYYLRHVGFLGAHPPAVKGLKPANFAEGEVGVVEFSEAAAGLVFGTIARLLRGLREMTIGSQGQEAADRALPAWDIDAIAAAAAPEPTMPAYAEPTTPAPQENPPVTEHADAARLAALEAEAAQLRDQVAAFAEREAAAQTAEDAAFLERLQAEGRLLPANAPRAAGLLAQLGGGQALAFAEGRDPETPRAALRALLAAQPVAVEFREVAGGTHAAPQDDPAARAIAAQALQDSEAAAGRSISFAEAVARVGAPAA
jgi:hypothetical protein